MNRPVLLISLCALASCQALNQQAEPEQNERIRKTTLLVGQRQLKEDAWSPVEDHLLIGAEVSSISRETKRGSEFGIAASFDSETEGSADIDARLLELYLGGRFQAVEGNARPFISAGGVVTYSKTDASIGFLSGSADDTSLGFYVHGGVSVSLSDTLEVVFDLRRRFGPDADFNGVDVDIDYFTFAVGLSF